ncbi:oligosaccharide flippase family protein [Sinorhizobium fredii]|uniref:oligosaccharide flippase family protein n=1 Tax=Rhizobium fredii TaxID=380 RepID=UPI0012973013|nr:oligosaccharide flippase family protein [Sinorhizobium fredii]MQW96232.1 oligosaccharide flippase family protein [Sinorhizobium fredii]UTY46262.1 sugar transporter [Sinorhizobium fredii]
MGIKRALLFSTGDRYFALACNFATAAAVSRILTPAEIGISVIGMAVIGIALSVREFVSGSFVIQRQDLGRDDVRAAFSAMLVLTGLITAALTAVTPLLVASYGEEKLALYLRLTSLCLFFDLIPIQVVALLRRDMAFGKVAVINVSGAAAGACTTLALAWIGFSYMSFAWGWLATSIVTALLALWLRPHFWMFKPSFRQWRAIAEFGGYNGVIVLLYKVYEALPFLLLGRIVSPHAAALFSRTLMVCQVPDKLVLGGAMSVFLPAFSAQAREGRDLKQPYLSSLEMVTAFHWPALLVLAALAHPAIDIVLGSQWSEAVPLVQIVAVASLFTFSFELNYPVMVAMGSIRELFVRSLITIPVSATAMTASVVLGGLHGAALVTLFVIPFQASVTLAFVRRRLCIEWSELAAAVRRSGIVALSSAAGPLAVAAAAGFTFELSLWLAAAAVVLAAFGWVAGLLITRHPLLNEISASASALRRSLGSRFRLAAAASADDEEGNARWTKPVSTPTAAGNPGAKPNACRCSRSASETRISRSIATAAAFSTQATNWIRNRTA